MPRLPLVLRSKKLFKFLKKTKTRDDLIKKGDPKYVSMLSAIVFRDVMSHFESELGPKTEGGKPVRWQKWSKVTKEHYLRTGKGGNQILQDTGHMRNNFNPSKYRKVKEGILWFNPTEYAGMHDRGSKKKNMPMRKFMWLSEIAMKKIAVQTNKFRKAK